MEAFIGTIMLFGGNYAPEGWMFCHGQLLPVNQYAALYSILGMTYGGNGTTNFALPDLRGRVPAGFAQGPGLTNYALGARFGAETVTLTANQLPAHTHAATVTVNAGTDANLSNVATGKALSSDAKGGDVPPMMYTDSANTTKLRADAATATVAAAGGNQAHENRQPSLAMNYIMCVNGLWPSRP